MKLISVTIEQIVTHLVIHTSLYGFQGTSTSAQFEASENSKVRTEE